IFLKLPARVSKGEINFSKLKSTSGHRRPKTFIELTAISIEQHPAQKVENKKVVFLAVPGEPPHSSGDQKLS
ncbi:unnamed protein product, partial [Acanthoscelides obtectus]